MDSISIKTGGGGISLYTRISFEDLDDLKTKLCDDGAYAYSLESMDRFDRRSSPKVRCDLEQLSDEDIAWVEQDQSYEQRSLVVH